MSSRNVLLVALEPVSEEELKTAIDERKDADDLNVHVVAPASTHRRLQWLTDADDEAREDAGQLAERTAAAVDAETETEVGDRNPLLAVRDALAVFPADEIIVAGTADEATEETLDQLGVPVSRLERRGEATGEHGHGVEEYAHEVVQGRRAETPFVVVGTVAAVILAAVAVLTLILFLAYRVA
jgi:hypothetical protein